MSRRFEVLLSGSREQGIDGWDPSTSAHLFQSNNVKLSASSNTTIHSYSAAGKHQLVTTDITKPYLHTLTFSTSTTSSSSSTSALSSSLPSLFSSIALSPSGLFLAAASSSSPTLFLFSLRTSSLLSSFSSHYKPITSLLFTPDERFIISGGEDGCVNVTALADCLAEPSDPLSSFLSSPPPSSSSRPHISFASHSLPITSLCMAPGSIHSPLFSSSLDHTVHVHSLITHTTIQRFIFPSAIQCCIVTPTLSSLFAAGVNGILYHQPLIHTSSSSPSSSPSPVPLLGHTLPITCLSLSFDASLLASASRDGTLRLWETRSRQCVRVVKRVGRTSFDWCRFVREGGEGRDWPQLRAGRRRAEEEEAGMRVRVRRGEVRAGEEEARREWEDFLEDWREQSGQDEVTGLRRQVESERQKRMQAEKEAEEWSLLARELYRKTVRKLIEGKQAAENKTEGKEEEIKESAEPDDSISEAEAEDGEAMDEEETGKGAS